MKKHLIFGLLLALTWSINAQKKELRTANKAIGKANFEQASTALDAAEALMSSMDEKQKDQFYFLKSKLLFKDGAAELEDINKSIDAYAKVGSSIASTDKNEYFQNLINHMINKGSASNDKSDFTTASDYFYNAYKLSSKDTIYLYYAASMSVSAKDYDTSLEMYEKLRALGFTGIEKQYFAVNTETNKEEVFDSEVLRDLSVKSKSHTNPTFKNTKSKYPEIIKNMALIYNERGETDKALEAMREARAQNPDDLDLVIEEANVHFSMGNMDKFKELLEYATKLNPENIELQFNLGVIAANAGDVENATKYYERALELNPNYANAFIALLSIKEKSMLDEMNNLGTSAADDHRYDELLDEKKQLFLDAIRYLEKVLESDSTNPQVVQTLSFIYSATGNDAKAKEYKDMADRLQQ
jgi:tetratricopeptide (TPR) repeat protein